MKYILIYLICAILCAIHAYYNSDAYIEDMNNETTYSHFIGEEGLKIMFSFTAFIVWPLYVFSVIRDFFNKDTEKDD